MSDVIANAKRLLERATPGPWSHDDAPGPGGDPMRETEVYQKSGAGVIAYVQPLQGDIELIAAAPELAQALAEETYEYSYHIQNTIGMWEHPTPRAGDPERWWDTRGEAEESALAAHECGYPIRIVRRRVSPPEVINE